MRHDSRVVLEQVGEEFPTDTMILASIADSVRGLLYALTAKKGDKLPPSVVEALTHKQEDKQERGFMSGADFERARTALLKRLNNG